MSGSKIEVIAPSRLHFGMFSFGDPDVPQFGGVGVMIERPGLKLHIASADRFEARGPASDRVQTIVERLVQQWQLPQLPACRIEVVDAPAQHVGLGTGTQLALAVTAGLNTFRDRTTLDASRLAALSGRGGRSAIGTYGFLHGGFLVESGKRAGDVLSPLEHRAKLPADWHFVLILLADRQGLSGDAELAAFRDLPPVDRDTTEQLRRVVTDEMLPAIADADFARFSRAVYRFGHRAGMCFAARQGGAFAGPQVAELVETVRGLGVEGVGQSSWGPTVFALLENEQAACQFADKLSAQLGPQDSLIVTKPNSAGARIIRIK